jgi:type IV secretion system protein VirB8
MILRKKPVTPSIENAVAQSVNYEVTVFDIARRSERRAWMVAFMAIIMSLILAGGYYYMLPLKEKVPYLIMADANTGTSTVARLTTDTDYQAVTANEAINKSNVAHFVYARESYDYSLIGDSGWLTVHVMATNSVSADYRAVHAEDRYDSPGKVYGADKSIRVKILSISLLGGSDSAVALEPEYDAKGKLVKRPPTGASVRIQRYLYEKATGKTQLLDSKIVRMEFSYNPNLKMTDEGRVLNPLGFQVTAYRADNDFAEAPPPEYVVPATPAAAPVQTPSAPVPGTELPAGTVAPDAASPNAQTPAAPIPNNTNGAPTR